MKKLILAVLALGIATQSSWAVSTSTASVSSVTRAQLKETPFGLVISSTAETAKDTDKDIDGVEQTLDVLLSYKLTENDDLRLYPGFSIAERKGIANDAQAKYEFTELRYRRKNLLTQKTNGVDLELQLRYAAVHSARSRAAFGDSGSLGQVRAVVSKDLSDKLSVSSTTRLYVMNRKSSVTVDKEGKENSNLAGMLYVDVSPAYSITDKVAAGIYLRQRVKAFADDSRTLDTLVSPNAAFTVNDDVTLTAYAEFTPVKSNDGRTFAKVNQITRDSVYGLTLDVKAF